MRSSNPRERSLGAIALTIALLVPGCIAAEGQQARLSASQGSGDLVLYLRLVDDRVEEANVWWAEDAPEGAPTMEGVREGTRAIILKNDVVVDREPLQGDEERSELYWETSTEGAIAQAGDAFEVLIVNTTGDSTVASWSIDIQP